MLVDAPETLVEALADLGEGRLTLVSPEPADDAFAPSSLAAKVQGPGAIRRILSKLHAAETLADARALLPQLPDGESIITRQGERLGTGWVRVLRSGAAKQGALLRAREIQSLRADIEQLQQRERALDATLTGLRDNLLAAEQQREDAQRASYHGHRSVSELAGQLQSQQGRLESARNRIARIDAETAQLVATLESSRGQAREARARLEQAVSRMGELETARHGFERERSTLRSAAEAISGSRRRSPSATASSSSRPIWCRARPGRWSTSSSAQSRPVTSQSATPSSRVGNSPSPSSKPTSCAAGSPQARPSAKATGTRMMSRPTKTPNSTMAAWPAAAG